MDEWLYRHPAYDICGAGLSATRASSVWRRSVSKTQVVVALDIGSAASRAMAFSKAGEGLAQSQSEYQTYFPGPGWVEQDALEIWEATQKALREVLSAVGAERVAALGLANQRETTLLWNRSTGQPLYRAIAWQCRRTVNLCRELSAHSQLIKRRTGLFLARPLGIRTPGACSWA
jgi:glycerol kinase